MIEPDELAWQKQGGLLPAIVQHAETGEVRMLGYMNQEALKKTMESRRVVFWSRSREALWEKGATSGNGLEVVDIKSDCDADALLVTVRPEGATCHLGTPSCFGNDATPPLAFLSVLGSVVRKRIEKADEKSSYTAGLYSQGIKRIAQKVGEEGVETALAAVAGENKEIIAETADLLYHLTVMLETSDIGWRDVMDELHNRQPPESIETASS